MGKILPQVAYAAAPAFRQGDPQHRRRAVDSIQARHAAALQVAQKGTRTAGRIGSRMEADIVALDEALECPAQLGEKQPAKQRVVQGGQAGVRCLPNRPDEAADPGRCAF
jgi:hypothetical protein